MLLVTQAEAGEEAYKGRISGYIVSGNSSAAKSNGFNSCVDNLDHYECARIKNTALFGAIALRATVKLRDKKIPYAEKESKLNQTPFDNLVYEGILFEFTFPQRRKLENALLTDGWILDSSSIAKKYYRKNIDAYIAIHQSYVAIVPAKKIEIDKKISNLKQQSPTEKFYNRKPNAFIDFMSK